MATKKSFTEFNNIHKSDAIHLDRFMLLITSHREIVSVRRTHNAPNGRRYSVKFPAGKTWFVVDHERKSIAYGTEHVCHSVIPFDHLDRMADRRANVITWINGEFDIDQEQRRGELLLELLKNGTITFRKLEITPERLFTFHGHGATAEIGDREIHGSITQPVDGIDHIGVESTLFHNWRELNSITIKHV